MVLPVPNPFRHESVTQHRFPDVAPSGFKLAHGLWLQSWLATRGAHSLNVANVSVSWPHKSGRVVSVYAPVPRWNDDTMRSASATVLMSSSRRELRLPLLTSMSSFL